ncbi:hypothetical protein [Sphingobium sp. Sx8-8]|uniref:hypothetical protein n=1 Tax=Sphingobium sp. Sx8-8 TaxID=2933617 RepID=UPI001F5A72B1|nr:hypothetical protein [Sphingobium sp. Sx8-8]
MKDGSEALKRGNIAPKTVILLPTYRALSRDFDPLAKIFKMTNRHPSVFGVLCKQCGVN